MVIKAVAKAQVEDAGPTERLGTHECCSVAFPQTPAAVTLGAGLIFRHQRRFSDGSGGFKYFFARKQAKRRGRKQRNRRASLPSMLPLEIDGRLLTAASTSTWAAALSSASTHTHTHAHTFRAPGEACPPTSHSDAFITLVPVVLRKQKVKTRLYLFICLTFKGTIIVSHVMWDLFVHPKDE